MSLTKVQTDARREKQMRDAEELLFTGTQKLGVAKGLFLGRFVADWVMPYPKIAWEQETTVPKSIVEMRVWLGQQWDTGAIDLNVDIPRPVIDGLAQLGVAVMTELLRLVAR